MAATDNSTGHLGLRSRITCPHCWHEFPPRDIRWVSAHPDLRGDPKLGDDAQLRFLASHFDVRGQALDAQGVPCSDLACPHCHLRVSRALVEMRPLFFSVLGAPGSGKSYYLATAVWQLRRQLGPQFELAFSDADPEANRQLNEYEEKLFLNPQPHDLVALPKTEKEGDLYEAVRIGQRTVWYPKPFVFSIQPNRNHPHGERARAAARAVCLYDNAGEHFLPGGQTPSSPGTQHLSLSQALLFLFDPTQHPQVRRMCEPHSDDPQLREHGWSHRQDQILFEAATRIRSHSGLGQDEKYRRPLIIVVTKYDAWCSLFGGRPLSTSHVLKATSSGVHALDLAALSKVSSQLRETLLRLTPELVAAADSFCEDVLYVPVSALGRQPVLAGQGFLGVRPADIRPMWVEIPLIYALHRAAPHLVPALSVKRRAAASSPPTTRQDSARISQRSER